MNVRLNDIRFMGRRCGGLVRQVRWSDLTHQAGIHPCLNPEPAYRAVWIGTETLTRIENSWDLLALDEFRSRKPAEEGR